MLLQTITSALRFAVVKVRKTGYKQSNLAPTDKGEPIERWGRKATGLQLAS